MDCRERFRSACKYCPLWNSLVSFVLLATPFQPLESLICSWKFFFCQWQFTSTSLPVEGRSLYKIHKLFTWIRFHITQAGWRPLNAVQRIKAGHSLYQRHAHWHFGGDFSMISNVRSHVPSNSGAYNAEYQHSFLLPLTSPFLHLHCSVASELSKMLVHLHRSICPLHTMQWKCSFSHLYRIICACP